ncbi:LysE family translocator [Novosphingobium umbonatum]|uniref:LysE family translocator n=1 Tax=Novosphingobium umbonatum TaxID=1908524 RepID=A0A3S2X4B5_9SPHN|nr:LysE family translocator [Novosphingobium umbonatum]RVU05407.1 LysE family translocator [Novosphingobium umbonatum]
MSLHQWLLFAVAVFFVSATPGPNMLHIMSRSVELGLRRSFPAMAGCMSALVVMMGASALGLTAILMALPGAFDVLRYVGTAYLVYLGIKAWRAPVEESSAEAEVINPKLSPFAIYRGGFAIALSNPKALLFVAAFLPQFIDPNLPKLPQFAIMVATFAVIETTWYFTYALGGRGLASWLEQPSAKRLFNRITGGVFVGFGALLLKSR